MKVIAINGSPKAEGNTYHAIKLVADEMAKDGIETEIIHVGNKVFRGCMACGGCIKNRDEKCVFDDGINEIIQKMKEAGLPYVVVLTHPVYGGVTASLAMLGDVHIAEPKAMIGFAGKRVIEQTVREKLEEPFQRAEYLLDHGVIDQIVHRHALRDTVYRIISKLMNLT